MTMTIFMKWEKQHIVRYEVQAGPVSVNTGITFDTGIKALGQVKIA